MEAYQFAASKGAERYLEKVGETKLAAAQSIVPADPAGRHDGPHGVLRACAVSSASTGGRRARWRRALSASSSDGRRLQGQMTDFIEKLRTKKLRPDAGRVSPEATVREALQCQRRAGRR
jgi:hypothetical protein